MPPGVPRRLDPPASVGAPTTRLRSRRRVLARWVLASAVLLVVAIVAFVAFQYVRLSDGLRTSSAISAAPGHDGSPHGDMNLLVMGLDSRLDEDGHALPAATYQALHAGDQSSGGENANVLIVLHVPGDGSKSTAFSIPRDDYVQLAGCPDGECMGKIKQAYGLAFDQAERQLANQGVRYSSARVQRQRDAGRRAEITTVEQLLGGGLHIDHFVEVTLVAFYELAKVVQPITVCVNEATSDRYSGADFKPGRQQINAGQALAFVRQRRDDGHLSLNFTDLDRERRQQAFIAALAFQLRQAGTLANPLKVSGIVDVGKANIAIDNRLNLLGLVKLAAQLSGGNLTFYTLPVKAFGRSPRGEDVNLVDLPLLQATVRSLLSPPQRGTTGSAAPTGTPVPVVTSGAVEVLNATGRAGLAGQVEHDLVTTGYRVSRIGTANSRANSVVEYSADSVGTATSVARSLGGLATAASATVPAGMVRVLLGADYTTLNATARPVATAVSGTGTGRNAPSVTALTAVPGGGVPCVK